MRHTKTRIYQRTLELLALCGEIQSNLPQGYAFLADQLRRASSSVLLNYSEGFGKRTRRDRLRYFSIAKGSALEVAAAFDVAEQFGLLKPGCREHAHDVCDHIAAMLHKYR